MGAPTKLLIANPNACGMGAGENCCAWLMMGPEGMECGRVTPLRETLASRALSGAMTARRLPDAPYPDCQLGEAS